MKRSWIGFFLLIILLALGILGTWAMEQVHDPIARDLQLAAEGCLKNNWSKAAFHTAKAKNEWEKWQLLRACLTDHDPMEQIDALFCALDVYGRGRETIAFSALAREMAVKIQAIGDAHGLVWNNIL